MSRPLRVLIAEDDPADAELVVRALHRAGFAPEWHLVQTERDFVSWLSPDLDVILSDFVMPSFSGLRALEILQSRNLDIPFIIVSGTIGEEIAVEAMKNGAADYLLKDRLARLGQSINQAVEKSRLRQQRKQAEEALRVSNAKLQQLLSYSPAILYTLRVDSTDMVPILVSENIMRLLGFPSQLCDKKWWEDHLHPEDREHAVASVAETIDAGSLRCEYRFRRSDGEYVWIEDNRQLVRNTDGKPKEIVGVWTDITARKLAEDALRESERRMREMLENVELLAMMLDTSGRVTFCNDHLLRITGWRREEVVGMDWHAKFQPGDLADAEAFCENVRSGSIPPHQESSILTKDRQLRQIVWSNTILRDESGRVLGTAGIGEDVTERKALETRFMRAQRMESIGTLAGGIAHDLNNVLAPILVGVDFLKSQYPDASAILNRFEISANRGAGMVRQLLTFAKGAKGEQVSIQISHLVMEIKELMVGTFPKNIRIEINCASHLPTVLGDASQLHQILLNLCVNARDAMPSGGTLTVESHVREVDAIYAASVPDALPGTYVVLKVADTGTGIPPGILDRIFDPFFTTKGPDKGSGLGLSTVMGVVKGMGGFLQVTSTPRKGSTFAVFLPAEKPAMDAGRSEIVKETPFCGKGETILLVDDEAGMLEVGRLVLESLNFEVVTAVDGADAMLKVAENHKKLRAIVTDMHMPYMDGVAFIRTLRRLLPDVPVLIGSGHLDHSTMVDLGDLGAVSRLDKPYTQDMLSAALARMLAAPGATQG